jgi:hypothetical protein
LHQAGVGDENFQSLVVRYMGMDQQGVSSYHVTCYFSRSGARIGTLWARSKV